MGYRKDTGRVGKASEKVGKARLGLGKYLIADGWTTTPLTGLPPRVNLVK